MQNRYNMRDKKMKEYVYNDIRVKFLSDDIVRLEGEPIKKATYKDISMYCDNVSPEKAYLYTIIRRYGKR